MLVTQTDCQRWFEERLMMFYSGQSSEYIKADYWVSNYCTECCQHFTILFGESERLFEDKGRCLECLAKQGKPGV